MYTLLISQVHQRINVHTINIQNVVKNIMRYEMLLVLKKSGKCKGKVFPVHTIKAQG